MLSFQKKFMKSAIFFLNGFISAISATFCMSDIIRYMIYNNTSVGTSRMTKHSPSGVRFVIPLKTATRPFI